MKTIQNIRTGKIMRRQDTRAHLMIETGDWKYIPKSSWKTSITANPEMEFANPLKKRSNKMSKAMKRHLKRKK